MALWPTLTVCTQTCDNNSVRAHPECLRSCTAEANPSARGSSASRSASTASLGPARRQALEHFLGSLLQHCPDMHILVTATEAIGISTVSKVVA